MNARRNTLALVCLAMVGCGGGVEDNASSGAPTSPPLQAPPPAAASSPAWDHLDIEGEVTALATSPSSVCWSSFVAKGTTASVVACSDKISAHRTDLVRDTLVHPGIAATAEHVYWSTEVTATIDRAPLVGGAITPVVTKAGPHGRFVLASDSLYWLVDGGAGSVLFSAGTSGGAAPTMLTNLGAVDTDLLSIVNYTVYDWPLAFSFGIGVMRNHAHEGEASEKLSGVCFYPTDLQADSEYVYWSCQDRTLHWVPQRGGVEHVERDVGYGRIAIWRGLAYLTDVNGGRVLRVRARDGAIDVVQTGLDRTYHIAVDDSGIYVAAGPSLRRFPL